MSASLLEIISIKWLRLYLSFKSSLEVSRIFRNVSLIVSIFPSELIIEIPISIRLIASLFILIFSLYDLSDI